MGFSIVRWSLAFVISFLAVYDDHKRFKISNRLILLGLIISFLCNLVSIFRLGFGSAADYFLAEFCVFLCLLFLYLIHCVRAGDVKLLTVIAAFLGCRISALVVLVSMLAGVVIGVVELSLGRAPRCESINIGGNTIDMHGYHYSYGVLTALCVTLILNLLGYF